jgi:hypothetical protein
MILLISITKSIYQNVGVKMKNIYLFLIIIVSILFVVMGCSITAEDPDWTDFDGDGISGYDDIDDILIIPLDDSTFSTLTPVLTIKLMNPDIVSRYWIQIFPRYDNFEEFILFDKDDYTTNECLIPEGILYDGGFIWRAKAYDNVDGRWSNSWTDEVIFAIETGIPNVSPANGGKTIDSTPLLDWNDFPDAVRYHLQVGSSLASPTIDDDTLTETHYQIDYIIDHSYSQRWRVKHLNLNGVWSEWSQDYSFSVYVRQPLIPNPINSGFVRSPKPILDWEDIPGVDNYKISIWKEDNTSVVIGANISESQFQLGTRLDYSENYNWRVYSQNEDGVWGDNFMDPTIWQFSLTTINFTEHVITGNYNAPSTAYAADIDSDGDLDLLGAEYLGDNLDWWENDGTGSFTGHTIDSAFVGGRCVFSVDMDDDGDMDIIGGSPSTNTLAWWENDSSENFTKHVITTDFASIYSIYASDFNGDGFMDIVSSSEITGEVGWWKNDGNENFTKFIISANTRFWDASDVYAVDIDGDTDIDILGAVNVPADVVWWENNGDETFTEHIIDSEFDDATSVHAADMDHDGDVDVISVSDSGKRIAWWENDGNEVFAKHLILDNVEASSLYVADLNMDDELDIIVTLADTNDIIWFENDADGGFTQRTIDSSFHTLDSVYAGDFDGDGDIDVYGPVWVAVSDIWWENDVIQ